MPMPPRTDPVQAVRLLQMFKGGSIGEAELRIRLGTECKFPSDLIAKIVGDATDAIEKGKGGPDQKGDSGEHPGGTKGG